MASSSFKDTSSEATGSMRSPLSSFMRSPMSSSMMPSPVSSRLTMEFESAFMMEQEEPIRFLPDILPYLSQPSSCSSSSDFDTQSSGGSGSGSTSFCDLNDSNRITLGSLIGLPMADSFRNFGESLRLLSRGDSHYDSGSSNRSIDGPPRRSRSCSLLGDIFRCLQRTRTDYVNNVPVGRNMANLASFTITEVSEEEERDSDNDSGPTVFENSVFVERDTLGSRIYEFNPLYATSEVDPASRDVSLVRESPASEKTKESDDEESTSRLSIQVSTPTTPTNALSPPGDFQPLSPMRTVLTAICCRLGDDCPSD